MIFWPFARPVKETEPTRPPICVDELKAVMYGLAIGDALGVPYEFRQRGEFDCTGMDGHGTHDQPAGTWSDDTGMSLATLDSLTECDGHVDTADLLMRYRMWLDGGAYMPDRQTYDCGLTVASALRSGRGRSGEHDNGNGSLMRVAPCAFYRLTDDDIRRVSAVTHSHETSMGACVRYVRIIEGLLRHDTTPERVVADSGLRFRQDRPREEIRSDGFVLHTLDAALWCLLNTGSYRECVLAAVNLGADSDTTASVAGALAGAVYGMEGIPAEWVRGLRRGGLIGMYVDEATSR